MRPHMTRVVQLLRGEEASVELKQKKSGGRTVLLDGCDVQDYTYFWLFYAKWKCLNSLLYRRKNTCIASVQAKEQNLLSSGVLFLLTDLILLYKKQAVRVFSMA
ncbi:hypothetical protein DKX38_022434 [Salix brachista]|uniref:Uncharacterized protein n=1 Tax=Salix brachista TaxID=2182728 RepID=A0A5N5K585_9ROSI|nr:hypothetical protein DKX38_022434 [Salix brachista]